MKKTKNEKNSTDVSQALKNKNLPFLSYADMCISCGADVPEGRMICLSCENQYKKTPGVIFNRHVEKENSGCNDLTVDLFNLKDKEQK